MNCIIDLIKNKTAMHRILIQRAERNLSAPNSTDLRLWAKHVLREKTSAGELTIRIVGKNEMTSLNHTYRQKNYPTNILSFPFEMPDDVALDIPLLGDLVVCADVVNQEAIDQGKTPPDHWAHMIVHGTLHLLGYDHEIDADAVIMEAEEIRILQSLGINNPYTIKKGSHNE